MFDLESHPTHHNLVREGGKIFDTSKNLNECSR